MKFKIALLLFFGLTAASAQNRINDKNNIGCYVYSGTFALSERFGIHTQYQWRREGFIENWQQGLLRLGMNYKLFPDTQLRVGYAWAETYPYGDFPLNGFGKDFTEHRAYEMVTITDKVSALAVTHRFMLEQRWVGRYSNTMLTSEDSFVYTNRLRYILRLQLPIQKDGWYVAIYDELFCGFGENVGENIFDQNRFGAIIGYPFTKNFRIEGGYLNQIVQLGREVDNKNVFQKNNGFIISGLFNFDLRKPQPTSIQP